MVKARIEWGGGGEDLSGKIQTYLIHIVKLPNTGLRFPSLHCKQNYSSDSLRLIKLLYKQYDVPDPMALFKGWVRKRTIYLSLHICHYWYSEQTWQRIFWGGSNSNLFNIFDRARPKFCNRGLFLLVTFITFSTIRCVVVWFYLDNANNLKSFI